MESYKILEGEFGKDITLSAIQGFDKFKINSPGGGLQDGYLLHDEFNSNKSEVGVVGLCASAGTIALIGAAKNGNAWGSKNSEYLIHYPWGGVEGTAEDMYKTANELQAAQDKLINFYKQNLNIEDEELIYFCENEIPFGSAKALEIGLINEIREDDLKPLKGKTIKEKFYNLKIETMSKETISKEDLNKELEGFGSKILDRIKNLLPSFKNLVLKDTAGTELDFGVEAVEEITVGTKVNAEDGEYIMEDGTVYVIAAGEVAEIKPPEPDEMEALKTENQALKAEIEANKTTNEATLAEKDEQIRNLTTSVEEIGKEVESFKNIFSKKITNSVTPSPDKVKETEGKHAFKSKRVIPC